MPMDLGDAVVKVKADTTAMMASIGGMKKQVGIAMAAVGTGILVGLGKATQAAATFEQAITNAASVTGKTGEEFTVARDKMEALAKTLGATTVFTAQEAANAMYDLASKGFDVASMSVEELEPLLNLASATQNDLTDTTETATATLRGFGMENKELARVADVFTYAIGNSGAKMEKLGTSMPIVATTSKILNVSLEETVATLGELYDKGIESSTAATGLRNVMQELNKPTKRVADGFEALGISLKDVDIKSDGIVGTFKKLREQGLKADQALAIFGKRSGTVAAAVLESVDAIEQFDKELDNAGGTAKTVAELQLDTLINRAELMKSGFMSIAQEIGDAFIPALTKLAEVAAKAFGEFGKFLQQHPLIAKALAGLTAAIGVGLVAGGLLLALTGLKTLLITLATTTFPLFIAAIINATTALIAFASNPVVLALIAIALLVVAVVKEYGKVKDAREQLAESEARLAKAEIESKARMAKARTDEIWQKTGYTRKNFELIKADIEAQYGKTITEARLLEMLNQEHLRNQTLTAKKFAILAQLRAADLQDTKAVVGEKLKIHKDEVASTVRRLQEEKTALETSLREKIAGFKEELRGLEDLQGSEDDIHMERRLISKNYGEAIIKLRKLVGEKNTEIAEANRQLAISDTKTAAEIERAEQQKAKAAEDWQGAVENALVNIDEYLKRHMDTHNTMTQNELQNLALLQQAYQNMGGRSWFLDVMDNITTSARIAFTSIGEYIQSTIVRMDFLQRAFRETGSETNSFLLSTISGRMGQTAGYVRRMISMGEIDPADIRAEIAGAERQREIGRASGAGHETLNQIQRYITWLTTLLTAEQRGAVTINVNGAGDPEAVGEAIYNILQTEFSQGGTAAGFV